MMPLDTLSIILPVHNEKPSLEKVIRSWDHVLKQIAHCQYHFIICEDGSTDGTKELILDLMRTYSIKNLAATARRGYSQAVLAGLHAADSEYILCVDSDGQCDPEDFILFWQHRAHAHFVMGWRCPRHDPVLRLIYSKLFFMLHRLLFNSKVHDPSCPYVLGKKEYFLEIQPYLSFLQEGFWWGFVAACCKMKKTLFEIKIKHALRLQGCSRVYLLKKMPKIIVRNVLGLLKLRFAP